MVYRLAQGSYKALGVVQLHVGLPIFLPPWSNGEGDGLLSRKMGVRVPQVVLFLRVWHSGRAPAFQADYVGSIPTIRS